MHAAHTASVNKKRIRRHRRYKLHPERDSLQVLATDSAVAKRGSEDKELRRQVEGLVHAAGLPPTSERRWQVGYQARVVLQNERGIYGVDRAVLVCIAG